MYVLLVLKKIYVDLTLEADYVLFLIVRVHILGLF